MMDRGVEIHIMPEPIFGTMCGTCYVWGEKDGQQCIVRSYPLSFEWHVYDWFREKMRPLYEASLVDTRAGFTGLYYRLHAHVMGRQGAERIRRCTF